MLIEQAGFPSLSISGAAVTAAAMGLPDHSFLGADELALLVSRITSVTRIPLLVDCGAQLLFVNGIETAAQMEEIVSARLGVPLKFNNTIKRAGTQYTASRIPESI